MQKVIYRNEIQNYSEYIDQSVIDYIGGEQIETYESYDSFNLIAFDWYDLADLEREPAQILIYIDQDDVFYICENEDAFRAADRFFAAGKTNEQGMYLFFRNLFQGSTRHLEQIESRISALDDRVAEGTDDALRDRIIDTRNEILRIKKYYEQLEFLFEEICDNDNELISAECMNYFETLRNRSVRLVSQVIYLREYITQVRESYQSQIAIEQNDLMKVFTLVTSIFLPLTLIAGWYGMNVRMPEFEWKYGYPFVAVLCLVVGAAWVFFFKKKKWFK